MKFPLILAAFIALCGAVEIQNSAPQSSSSAQNLGTSDKTGSDSAQNSKPARDLAWLKDVNPTCAKYDIDTSAHPEFRAYARLKDGSALAFASPKAMFAYFFESGSSGANFGGTSAGANSANENSSEANSVSKNPASGNLGEANSASANSREANSTDANFGDAELYVTDYASGEILRAQDAFYVFGSVLQSARGDDLITFARLRDAQDFMREKKGHKILQFREISAKLIDYLR
ncbi:nitrous oxide reductase accessory protein NosL [uncultured Campylobacter sp.]|uniref:nitrous oxide reductase accessory protein NosL n=1 Tax=uncultured Campylobacter sp. TaxID=218934 RepID=UPI00262D7D56|nr:nitrous oxide reductase accessory protein NosL [uncultured Campylobacter sp.]